MQRRVEPLPAPDHEAYLTAVEELTLELQRAIIAVTTGALSDFEASLVRQRINCARLDELTSQWPSMAADRSLTMPATMDLVLANRTRAAIFALGAANRQYSMLVKHFGETKRLFAGMFRRYGGPAGMNFHQTSQSAWSCEL